MNIEKTQAELLESAKIGLAALVAYGNRCSHHGENIISEGCRVKAQFVRCAIANAENVKAINPPVMPISPEEIVTRFETWWKHIGQFDCAGGQPSHKKVVLDAFLAGWDSLNRYSGGDR